jgi:hypothetical protein
MDKETADALDKVYNTRASKDEVQVVRGLLVTLIIALLCAGGLGAYINSGTSERISIVETKIGNFAERQQENNILLKEIERLLREAR